MKKLLTIFAAAALCACVFGFTEFTGAAAQESIGAQLLLPETHEQYLDLQDPSDIAENEEYIAIADGNKIWLYDKAEKSYTSYTQQDADSVTSLNFYTESGETLLYFAADMSGSNPILWISCESPAQAVETQIKSCATFLIYGTDVYFANAQNSVFYTTMSARDILAPAGDGNITPGSEASNLTPSFAEYGGKVYFSWNKNIFLANKNNSSQHASATYNISSFAFTEQGCYYLSTEGYLYKQGGSPDVRVSTMQESEFSKICNTKQIYLICGSCLRAFSPQTEEYTGYEIARYSDSVNRTSLSSARHSFLRTLRKTASSVLRTASILPLPSTILLPAYARERTRLPYTVRASSPFMSARKTVTSPRAATISRASWASPMRTGSFSSPQATERRTPMPYKTPPMPVRKQAT